MLASVNFAWYSCLALALPFCCINTACSNTYQQSPAAQSLIKEYISAIKIDSLSMVQPAIDMQQIEPGIIKVHISCTLKDAVQQDDWKVTIAPAFTPAFHWAPHLTPADSNIIAQHVFRSPALIMANDTKQIVVVPDLDLIKKDNPVKWYMDMDALQNKMVLGISKSSVGPHVLFEKAKGQVVPAGNFEFGFYLLLSDDSGSLKDPWRSRWRFME